MVLMSNLECIICGTPLEEDEIFHGRRKSMEVVFCEEHKNYCDKCEVEKCNMGNCPLYKGE
ncbi:MAG: hypothetical protein ABEK36_05440 [Candidatus Aenigmatarchaeota archaeon]